MLEEYLDDTDLPFKHLLFANPRNTDSAGKVLSVSDDASKTIWRKSNRQVIEIECVQ
jgi:hypothetical protein